MASMAFFPLSQSRSQGPSVVRNMAVWSCDVETVDRPAQGLGVLPEHFLNMEGPCLRDGVSMSAPHGGEAGKASLKPRRRVGACHCP